MEDQSPFPPLVIAGSGTNLVITRILAGEFMRAHPELKIHVPASIGSTGGILAAADGAIALSRQDKGLPDFRLKRS